MLTIPTKRSSANRCYQYSSAQINLPQDLADRAVRWGERNIRDVDLFTEEEEPPSKRGRELESHVTIMYGIHEINARRVLSLFRNIRPFVIELGKISLFKIHKGFDVVKVEAFSSKLQELNSLVRMNVANTQLYPDYRPHVTVAFIKKNTCDHLEGSVVFANQSFVAREIQFSNYLGQRAVIYLG